MKYIRRLLMRFATPFINRCQENTGILNPLNSTPNKYLPKSDRLENNYVGIGIRVSLCRLHLAWPNNITIAHFTHFNNCDVYSRSWILDLFNVCMAIIPNDLNYVPTRILWFIDVGYRLNLLTWIYTL